MREENPKNMVHKKVDTIKAFKHEKRFSKESGFKIKGTQIKEEPENGDCKNMFLKIRNFNKKKAKRIS